MSGVLREVLVMVVGGGLGSTTGGVLRFVTSILPAMASAMEDEEDCAEVFFKTWSLVALALVAVRKEVVVVSRDDMLKGL